MSPREVHGLQALAMANGGTLTINPQTGLPEAGFLDNLLPALAGFALNAFVPGLGEAVGGMFGLGGAAGTGIAVGGATALASGDLSKGLMAGLGAYGGAGLGGNLLSAGDATMAGPPVSAMGLQEGAAAQAAAPVSTLERMQAGLGSMGNAPMDALKSNYMNLGLAAAPALSDAFGEQPTSNAPKQQIGNRYMYKVDPLTGQSYAYKTYTGDEIKDSPPVRFGNANGGLMQHYDDGGVVSRDFSKDPVKFGNVTDPVDINGNPFTADQKDMRSDSERAQDYLSGKGPNPFLFYHKAPTVDPIQKAAEATKTLQEEIKEDQKRYGGGNPADRAAAVGSSVSNYAPDVNSYSNGQVHALLNPVANNAPVVDAGVASGFKSVAEAEAGQRAKVLNAINNTNFSGMDKGSVSNAPSTPDTKEVQDRINNTNFSGMDRSSFGTGTGTSTDKVHDSENSATGERDHDPSNSRGGFLNHGHFNQRYAYGGGIAALNQGGMYNLGSYSDGGRLLRGPGDGVSDSIPATIGEKQPARLADGEFVVPARIVSELGNGSTEAGARKLYAMMDRVQKARSKTVGKDRVAANTRSDNYLPA
jgi:hypothetical protein